MPFFNDWIYDSVAQNDIREWIEAGFCQKKDEEVRISYSFLVSIIGHERKLFDSEKLHTSTKTLAPIFFLLLYVMKYVWCVLSRKIACVVLILKLYFYFSLIGSLLARDSYALYFFKVHMTRNFFCLFS